MKFSFFLIIFFISFISFSKQVEETFAFKIATNFYNSVSSLKSFTNLKLTYKSESNNIDYKRSKVEKNVHYYVFTDSLNGFVIVSGNDATYPILGYSNESGFDYNLLPFNVKKWLDNYDNQIRDAFNNNLQPTPEIESIWNEVLNASSTHHKRGGVSALLKTKWDQAPYFNDFCPYDNYNQKRTLTGCVATAMAQIMKYWNYPLSGFGSHFYNENNFGTLGVDFSSSKYDWNNMPDIVNSKNLAVAKLMYDCGVAVEMDYGIKGSSSNIIIDNRSNYIETRSAEYALKTYFGYASTIQGLKRNNYTDESWIKILTDELNAGRPIQYAGRGQEGHAFVCDGYDINGSSIYFHMNWGWGSGVNNGNGNYLLNSLTTDNGSYNYGQQALIGIKPNTDNITFNLEINKSVTSDYSVLNYGEGFTISTDILNQGKTTFYGDLCAAIFNKDGVFIDSIEVKKNITLAPSYHFSNGITFSTDGNLKMIPGEYIVRIFFKTDNGIWSGINANNLALFTKDYTTITVKNINDFHLYAPLVLTPNTNIYSNEKFVVWASVINESKTNFVGSLDVSLYDLQGNHVITVETKDNLSLKTNNYYTNGLAFVNNNLNVPPGTYILAVMHKWGNTEWQLTGSTTNYLNPIQIIVQTPPLSPDKYESNNEFNNSYNFLASDGVIKTSGSNIHVDTDVDFYKFTFNNDKTNKVQIKLQDKYFSDNNINYSVDALFSYSLDGVVWSPFYDHILTDEITFNGPKNLYVMVSPYYEGLTGTYELEVYINNSISSNITEMTDEKIKIYPNPAYENIEIENFEGKESNIIIADINGKVCYNEKRSFNDKIERISIQNFPNGIYVISIIDETGTKYISKFSVIK